LSVLVDVGGNWKQLIGKNIDIASRVVRHVRPQHNCIMKSSFALILFVLLLLPFKLNFFLSSYLLLTNWVNKVSVDLTLDLSF